MLRSLFLKNWCKASVKKAVYAVSLSSMVIASGAAMAEVDAVIKLGRETTKDNPSYTLNPSTDNRIKETADGYIISITGDSSAIANDDHTHDGKPKYPTPPQNTIVVGENKTLYINQTGGTNTAVRLSAGVSNVFGLKIDGNLDIKTIGEMISYSDGIVYVNQQDGLANEGEIYLNVTGDMTINVSDVAISQSYGVGIAEGDFSVGGDFTLSMSNVTTRRTYGELNALYGLMLGEKAKYEVIAEDVATKYEFGGNLTINGIHLSYGNTANPKYEMIVRGISLEDPRWYSTPPAEGEEKLHNMTVEGDLIVKDVSADATESNAVVYGLYAEGKGASAKVKGTTNITGLKATTQSGDVTYVAAIEAGDHAKVELMGDVYIGVERPEDEEQPDGNQVNLLGDEPAAGEDQDLVGLEASGGKAANMAYAIATWEGASVYINEEKNKKVVVKGDIQNDNKGSEVVMNLCNGDSHFEGYTLTADAADAGSTDIHLSNNAYWYVPGENHLHGELNMGDKGKVYYASRSEDIPQSQDKDDSQSQDGEESSFTTLTLGTLSGTGGTFHMSVNVAECKGDQLVIEKGEQGAHTLDIHNESKTGGSEDVLVVTQLSGPKIIFKSDNVEVGNYTYTLVTDEEAGGVFRTYLRPISLSPTSLASLSMASVGAQCSAFLSNLGNLRSRMGEVRGRSGSGLWAQPHFWKDRIDSYGGTSFSQDVMSVAVGYDVMPNDKWIVGVGMSAGKHDETGNECVGRVSGDANSFFITPYGTWMHDNGTYVDIVGSAGVYDQDFDLYRYGAKGMSGDYTDFGVGISVEVGRKFSQGTRRIVDEKGTPVDGGKRPAHGWFVEPQAQMSLYTIFADDYTTSEGSTAKRDDVTSLTGRVGVVVGKDFTYGASKKGQVYAKAGFIHEFCGSQKVIFNGERFSENSILGSRFYYGIGADMEIRDNLHAYGEIGREEGAHYTREYDVRCGIKFSY